LVWPFGQERYRLYRLVPIRILVSAPGKWRFQGEVVKPPTRGTVEVMHLAASVRLTLKASLQEKSGQPDVM
jgi:hypothetical protein